MPQANDNTIPAGLCQCGCGQQTNIAPINCRSKKWIKGVPLKYVKGHCPGRIPQPASNRFWEKVNKNGPVPEYRTDLGSCWLWIGALNDAGYGVFYLKPGKSVLAHNFSYWEIKGRIQHGLIPDHLCRVHNCINPDHLEPVTYRENAIRGTGCIAVNAKKDRCASGHPLVPVHWKNTVTKRYCPICTKDRRRRRYLAHAEEEKAYSRARPYKKRKDEPN